MKTLIIDHLMEIICLTVFGIMAAFGYFTDPTDGLLKIIAASVLACLSALCLGYVSEEIGASMLEHFIGACIMVAGIMSGAFFGGHTPTGYFLSFAITLCFMLGILASSDTESDRPGYHRHNSFG